MNRRFNRIHAISDFRVSVPIPIGAEVEVAVGAQVKPGDKLYTAFQNPVLESYYLPELLEVKLGDMSQYVGRVGGEYVQEGELLAERLSAAGLVTKQVFAGVDGVVSTKRLDNGYLDILSEGEKSEVHATVYGGVKEILLNNELRIETDALQLEPFIYKNLEGIAENKESNYALGEWYVIGSGDSVYSANELKEDLDGKVVYCGQYLYAETAVKLMRAGAKALVAYGMDFNEFKGCGLPVVLLGGFGQLPVLNFMVNLIGRVRGKMVQIDCSTGKIYLVNPGFNYPEVKSVFAGLLSVDDKVIIEAVEDFGIEGSVADLQPTVADQDHCLVLDGSNRRHLVHKDNLLLVG